MYIFIFCLNIWSKPLRGKNSLEGRKPCFIICLSRMNMVLHCEFFGVLEVVSGSCSCVFVSAEEGHSGLE
jgi:hypothetical protein